MALPVKQCVSAAAIDKGSLAGAALKEATPSMHVSTQDATADASGSWVVRAGRSELSVSDAVVAWLPVYQ